MVKNHAFGLKLEKKLIKIQNCNHSKSQKINEKRCILFLFQTFPHYTQLSSTLKLVSQVFCQIDHNGSYNISTSQGPRWWKIWGSMAPRPLFERKNGEVKTNIDPPSFKMLPRALIPYLPNCVNTCDWIFTYLQPFHLIRTLQQEPSHTYTYYNSILELTKHNKITVTQYFHNHE